MLKLHIFSLTGNSICLYKLYMCEIVGPCDPELDLVGTEN